MTFRVTLDTKSNGKWIGLLSEYITNFSFADVQAKYPTMSEADWETAKAEILDYIATRHAIPGILAWNQTPHPDGNGTIQTFDFADEASFEDWKNHQTHTEITDKYDISFKLMKPPTDNFSLKEFYQRPGMLDDVKLGKYLIAKYQIENDTITSISHETV